MQFYPLGISNFATRAVSASIANSANFLTMPVVPTASFALNLRGPEGEVGDSVNVLRPKGERGETGDTGPRGPGVYLLSSSRVTCAFPFNLGFAALQEPQTSACFAVPFTYYSNATPFDVGSALYATPELITVVTNGYYSDSNTVWEVTNGIAGTGVACSGGGGGGGGCTGTCTDGIGCVDGCYCSGTEGVGTCTDTQPEE
jgi:hypothetical protein